MIDHPNSETAYDEYMTRFKWFDGRLKEYTEYTVEFGYEHDGTKESPEVERYNEIKEMLDNE